MGRRQIVQHLAIGATYNICTNELQVWFLVEHLQRNAKCPNDFITARIITGANK